MNPVWLMRMVRWVRHRPSWGRVKLVVGVVLVCFVIFGVELIWGWPDALRVQNVKP